MISRIRVGAALAVGGALALSACSDPAAGPPKADDELGAVDAPIRATGELAVYVVRFTDGTSETQYFLRNDGSKRRLWFASSPDVEPGAKVEVRGKANGDGIDVVRLAQLAPADDIGSVSSPLIGVEAGPPHDFCIYLVDTGTGIGKFTADAVGAFWFTAPNGINAYYQENSYGKTSLTGKVLGPFTYPMNTCDTDGMAAAVPSMAPDRCSQNAFVFPTNNLCAGWDGLAEGGSVSRPAKNVWFNGGGLSCVASAQEPGHNYGMDHSSSITCPGASFADNLSGCTHSEYGDKWDTMGDGCRHMNAWQKQSQKWFGGCNIVRVTSSGTFNLMPTERPCDGIQGMQIPFPCGKARTFQGVSLVDYYLEYRASIGFDMGMTPQVLLHATAVPPASTTTFQKKTWILFTTPTNKNQPGMTAGQSFTDPAGGLTITVTALDADKATIDVKIDNGSGGPTCLDGSELVPPGSTTCSGSVVTVDGGMGSGAGGTGGRPDAGFGGSGAAGRGGSAGSGGSGGAAGSSTGGSGGTGAGGTTGAGGASTGAAGAGTAGTGTAGAGMAGAGMAGSSGGHPPRSPSDGELQGGCACRLHAPSSSGGRSGSVALALVGLSGLAVRRRRRV